MKKIFNKIRFFLKNNFNGLNGAISLFLVLCMSPILTLALVLLEAERYQNANELVDEVIDISAFATLADYDSYLDERFGLIATEQDAVDDSEFETLLKANIESLGDSATITIAELDEDEAYSLSNLNILKRQILEYSEVTVMVELASDGLEGFLNLEELIPQLKEVLNNETLKNIEEVIDTSTAVAETGDAICDIIENIRDLPDDYEAYVDALKAYKKKCSALEDEYEDLQEVLEEAQEEENQSGSSEDGDEDNSSDYTSEIKSALNDLEDARAEFQSAAETLKEEINDYGSDISSILKAIENLSDGIGDLNGDDDSVSNLLKEVQEKLEEWSEEIAPDNDTFQDSLTEEVQALGDQIDYLKNDFKDSISEQLSKLNSSSYSADDIEVCTEEEFEENCAAVTIETIPSDFLSITEALIDSLDDYAEDDEAEEEASTWIDMLYSLMGLSILYDTNLDSCISYKLDDSSISTELYMDALSDLIEAMNVFTGDIASSSIIDLIKGVVKLFKALGEFLAAVVTWVTDIVNVIVDAVTTDSTLYDRMLLSGYVVYNFPNRTNYSSGSTLSGYSYKKVFKNAGGMQTKVSFEASLEQLSDIEGGTESTAFKGAEAEYVLEGGNVEYLNQAAAFFDIFMLRLFLDIIPILTNSEVSAMSSLAGPAAWVVKIAIIILEPFLETVIIVNGGSAYIVNNEIYLTLSGIDTLVSDLKEVGDIDDSIDIDSITKNVKSAFSGVTKSTKKSVRLLDSSYEEHLLLLIWLMVPESKLLSRISNIVETESQAKYDDSSFSLDNSYTYLCVNVSYKLNHMFNFEGLSGNHTINTEQYIGY